MNLDVVVLMLRNHRNLHLNIGADRLRHLSTNFPLSTDTPPDVNPARAPTRYPNLAHFGPMRGCPLLSGHRADLPELDTKGAIHSVTLAGVDLGLVDPPA